MALKTPAEIQKRLDNIHGTGIVTLDSASYKGMLKTATFVDKDYGTWQAAPNDVFRNRSRHPEVSRLARIITPEEVQKRLNVIFGPNIITLVKESYLAVSEKATFIDVSCGSWTTKVNDVLNKKSRHPNFSKVLAEELQERLDVIHGPNVVTLIKESYKGLVHQATFIDKDFGKWSAQPSNVLTLCSRHPKSGKSQGIKYSTSDGVSINELCRKVGISSFSGFIKLARDYSPEFARDYINSNLDANGKYINRVSFLENLFISKIKPLAPTLELWNKRPLEDTSIHFQPDFRLDLNNKALYVDVHGLYVHSNGYPRRQASFDFKYHYNRSAAFSKANLNYVQFFQDEINFKFPIVESIIKSRLGLITTSYFARKLTLKPVVDQLAIKQFLNDNHLMGYKANKAVGLFDTDKLVCLLTYAEHKNKVTIERFCTLLNTKCPGGFGKLVSYLKVFKKPLHSFCDLRYGNGHSYEALGFKNVGETVGFNWTDSHVRFNRLHCTATKDKTQKENAVDMKLFKIYDAGQRKYILELSPESNVKA